MMGMHLNKLAKRMHWHIEEIAACASLPTVLLNV